MLGGLDGWMDGWTGGWPGCEWGREGRERSRSLLVDCITLSQVYLSRQKTARKERVTHKPNPLQPFYTHQQQEQEQETDDAILSLKQTQEAPGARPAPPRPTLRLGFFPIYNYSPDFQEQKTSKLGDSTACMGSIRTIRIVQCRDKDFDHSKIKIRSNQRMTLRFNSFILVRPF